MNELIGTPTSVSNVSSSQSGSGASGNSQNVNVKTRLADHNTFSGNFQNVYYDTQNQILRYGGVGLRYTHTNVLSYTTENDARYTVAPYDLLSSGEIYKIYIVNEDRPNGQNYEGTLFVSDTFAKTNLKNYKSSGLFVTKLTSSESVVVSNTTSDPSITLQVYVIPVHKA